MSRSQVVAGILALGLAATPAAATSFVGPPAPRYVFPTVDEVRPLAPAPRWSTPLAVYCGGAVADLATTEVGIARGGHELNPLLRQRGIRIPAKVGICLLAAHRDREAQRRGSVTKRRLVIGALMAGQLAWNVRQIRRLEGRER